MQEQKTMLKIFTEEDIESFKPEMKIGLLATTRGWAEGIANPPKSLSATS